MSDAYYFQYEIDGNQVEIPVSRVNYRPASSGGLTYAPARRHLPRLRFRRVDGLWECRYVAQNDSYLGTYNENPVRALISTLRYAHVQGWPLWVGVS